MRPVIVLFAKAPVPGRVKTRLQPPLTPAQAAVLHTAFVHDALALLTGCPDADVELHTDIPTDAWPEWQVPRKLQISGDLGLRMVHALAGALQAGRPQAIIVGSDAPTLPAAHLRWLLDATADVALGPCDDGGYYAIACRRAHPRMFEGVEWSTPRALAQTRAAAERCGLTVVLGPSWFDVDESQDLERLLRSGALPLYTAVWAALQSRNAYPAIQR
jgi:rSAM/selenodomain-associated transferase 1